MGGLFPRKDVQEAGVSITPVVVFDEAGNTGNNLTDPDQPIFVLASLNIPADTAEALVGSQAHELKFKKLKKSAAGRRKIIELLNSSYLTPETMILSAIHKPFMIITKMVDLLIEPLYRSARMNLYSQGQNIALSNVLYCAMSEYMGTARFEELQSALVEMARTRTDNAIDRFYAIVFDAYKRSRSRRFRERLHELLSTRALVEVEKGRWDDTVLDPAVPTFLQHATMWTERLKTEFMILHDRSKPISLNEPFFTALMSTEEESVVVGYDRRKMVFPVKAPGIVFGDSEQCPQIQLADIVASAIMHVLKNRLQETNDAFSQCLLSTQAFKCKYIPLWPQAQFTPEQLGTEGCGGVDPNLYVSRRVASALGHAGSDAEE